MRRQVIRGLFAVVLLLGALGLGLPARAASSTVVVLPATGVVDSVLAGYLAEGIAGASQLGAAAVVVELDTPGGSLDATRRIVSAFLDAKVPVIVWVAPAGGRAASAGTFITLAANLAYMAPGTNIGAASPVDSNGQDIGGTLGTKIRNDAIAYITSIAGDRGRPVDWAVATVAEARSSAAAEAVALGAVDGIATSIPDVLRQASGRRLLIGGVQRTLDFSSVDTTELAMNPFQAFLHLLSDPNIAFLLFTLGLYGLFLELLHPNLVTGILGALAIILAFIGFGSLPLNVGGLLLVALAIVLFVLEPSVPSHGLLTVGGLAAFVLGASALFTTPGDPTEPFVRVATPLVAVMAVTTGLFMAFIAGASVRNRRLGRSPGLVGGPSAGLTIGTRAVVRRPLQPIGTIYASGEEWSARTASGASLERGAEIRVVGIEGLTATVEPEPSSSQSAPVN